MTDTYGLDNTEILSHIAAHVVYLHEQNIKFQIQIKIPDHSQIGELISQHSL